MSSNDRMINEQTGNDLEGSGAGLAFSWMD
jgi:hypothetical protein